MNIPYQGEVPQSVQNAQTKKRSNLIATILATFALAAGFSVEANEFDFQQMKVTYPEVDTIALRDSYSSSYNEILEEVRVIAKDMTHIGNKPSVKIYYLHVGLSNEVLYHVYDSKTNTWKFVGTDPSLID